jgi:hypothetical protein
MNKYQNIVINVGIIFCVLLLLGFTILVFLTFKEKKISKKVAPCPDYWQEVKDVRVVDVIPNMNNSNKIINEVSTTKTLCKVPSNTDTNIGKTIYDNAGNINLRNYSYISNYKRSGDTLSNSSIIPTPGFYWKAECNDGTTTCNNSDIKIWGNEYSGNTYTPSEFYIDFKDNDWHAYNMHKSTKCNLKNWANARGIVWDGITNMDC